MDNFDDKMYEEDEFAEDVTVSDNPPSQEPPK